MQKKKRVIGGRPGGAPSGNVPAGMRPLIDDDMYEAPQHLQEAESPLPKKEGQGGIVVLVDKINFANDDYRIFIGKLDGPKKTRISCKGNVGEIAPGMRLRLFGKYGQEHERFGAQFFVDHYTFADDSELVKSLLYDGRLAGIGLVMGTLLWETFGNELPSIVADNPERLKEIRGFGPATYKKFIESWEKEYPEAELRILLSGAGVRSNIISKVFERWSKLDKALKRIKENPYTLHYEIPGFPFSAADRIGMSLNFPLDFKDRIQAGIIHVLDAETRATGDCFILEHKLSSSLLKMLGYSSSPHELSKHLREMNENGAILVRSNDAMRVNEVWPISLWKAEIDVAIGIETLQSSGTFNINDDFLGRIPLQEDKDGRTIKPDEGQYRAIQMSCENGVSVITGGPGTGKTATMKTLIAALKMHPFGFGRGEILLCAPTGKAASRLSEAAGMEAKTIHRLLEYNPKKPHDPWTRNASHPLCAKAVIVDESSMIDIELMSRLMQAIPSNAKLVLVGDADQLPSVGPGNVLRDIIASNKVPVARLRQLWRQKEGSFIAKNASSINDGRFEDLRWNDNVLDFTFSPAKTAEKCVEEVVNVVKLLLDAEISIEHFQVLSPQHKGPAGVSNLNKVIQSVVNPYGAPVGQAYGHTFRVGDKIMQIENDYTKMVFNGEMGIITGSAGNSFDDMNPKDESGSFYVQFESRLEPTLMKKEDLNGISLAYASTIHKSQGSEISNVIQIASSSHWMNGRSLLYTGVTRAKEHCYLVGDLRAIKASIDNNKTVNRKTGLVNSLRESPGEDGRYNFDQAVLVHEEFEKNKNKDNRVSDDDPWESQEYDEGSFGGTYAEANIPYSELEKSLDDRNESVEEQLLLDIGPR